MSQALAFAIPGYALIFLLSGPHSVVAAMMWVVPLWLTVLVDMKLSVRNIGKPTPCSLPKWAYEAVLHALAILFIINIGMLLAMAAQLRWSSAADITTGLFNLFAIKIIVGTSSSFSGIIVAHELIHSPRRWRRQWGRLLLVLVCYEHFFTEHLRGHHRRVGTARDPATAYFGESYGAFWRRTVVAQFKSAWQLENQRLALHDFVPIPARLMSHQVLQGLLAEVMVLAAIAYYAGFSALVAFVVQAFAAVRKLEAANYFEHWGLIRTDNHSDRGIAWDTDSWFTRYAIIGLSRHTDHHCSPRQPYYRLQRCEESPKLPYGYFAMAFLVVWMNGRFQDLAIRELKARKLGPYVNG